MVSHTGIEPVTPWLKVMCSTDWANGSYYSIVIKIHGVTDGIWTRDNQCHKLALYQLNYGHHNVSLVERETRVELATFSLEGWRSTNWATPAYSGRSSRIWTCGPLLPRQVRYRTAPCTVFSLDKNYTIIFSLFCQHFYWLNYKKI